MNNPQEASHKDTVTDTSKSCKHFFRQIPKCNMAKCDCGKVIFRQNYDKR